MSQGRLPLFRVLFVDWHGVLSSDPFWSSVLNGRDRRLRGALERRLGEVFAGELGATWMRGEAGVGHVVDPVSHALGSTRRPDFLHRRLIEDCRGMEIDQDLADVLNEVTQHAFVVLATDNTSDFEHVFRRAQTRKPRPGPMRTLQDVAPLFDDVLCSSEVGVFKAEDPCGFFGAWLHANGLGFEDALLIDDRQANCSAFERCGGAALYWEPSESVRDDALHAIRRFAIAAAASPSGRYPYEQPRLPLMAGGQWIAFAGESAAG